MTTGEQAEIGCVEVGDYFDYPENFRRHEVQVISWLDEITNHDFNKADAERVFDFAKLYGVEPNAHIEGELTADKVPRLARDVQALQIEHVIWSPYLKPNQKLNLLDMSATALSEGVRPINGKKFVIKGIRKAWGAHFRDSVLYPSEVPAYSAEYFYDMEWYFRHKLGKWRYGLAEMTLQMAMERLGGSEEDFVKILTRMLTEKVPTIRQVAEISLLPSQPAA